jgi:diguanylate cyclase (GGDEF)-like protein/PAS domain S-box-containing protein
MGPVLMTGESTQGTARAPGVPGDGAVPASVTPANGPGTSPDGPPAAGVTPSFETPSATAPLRPLRAEILTDARGAVQSVDAAFTAILGWGPEEILGRRIGQLVHPDDLPRGLASWARMLERPGGVGSGLRLRYRHRDGGWVWFDVTTRNRLDQPDHGDVANEMVDVTREVTALDQLRVCEQLLDHVNEAVPVGLFYADREGRLVYVSRRLAAMTGVPAALTLGEQLAAVADTDRPRLRAAVQGAAGGSETGVELSVTDPGGGRRRWSLNLRPMRDGSGAVTGVTGCVQDVTALTAAPNATKAKTTTDALTGCLTQDALLATLADMVHRHRPPPANGTGSWRTGADRAEDIPKSARGTAVLMIDIDGLQTINDRYGQAAGDELLTVVALRIVDAVRSSDVVGRIDGDQFAVLCGGVPGPTTALTIGKSTLEQVCQPVHLKTAGSVTVRAHMGVSWTNQPDVEPARLVEQANEAMVTAKGAPSAEPVLAPA